MRRRRISKGKKSREEIEEDLDDELDYDDEDDEDEDEDDDLDYDEDEDEEEEDEEEEDDFDFDDDDDLDFDDDEDDDDLDDDLDDDFDDLGGKKKGKKRGKKHSRQGFGLAWKFIIIMVILLLVVGITLGVLVARTSGTALDNELRKTSIHSVKMLAIIGKLAILAEKEDNEKIQELNKEFDKAMKELPIFQIVDGSEIKHEMIRAHITRPKPDGTQTVVLTSAPKKTLKIDQGTVPSTVIIRGQEYSLKNITVDDSGDAVVKTDAGDTKVYVFQHPISNDGQVIGYARVFMSPELVQEVKQSLYVFTACIVAASLVICFVIAYFLGKTIAKPVNNLLKDMDTVSNGDLEHKTRATSADEIGLLASNFNLMTRKLYLAKQNEIENEKREHEMSIASEIQNGLLPKGIAKLPGYDIHAFYKPAKEVGGDYYDFLPIVGGDHLGFVVADVSGKGITGGLVMSMTRTIMRIASRVSTSPSKTLEHVNSFLAKDIPSQMFVTMLYAVLNVKTKELVAVSAGHNPMVIYRAETKDLELINPPGIATGIDKGPLFSKALKEQPVKLYPGDRVVLYTDGVVEAMNKKQEEYSDDRFYNFCKSNARKSSKEFVNKLFDSLEEWRGRADQHDDITICTFKVL